MQRRFFLRYAAALIIPAVASMGGINMAQAQVPKLAGFPAKPIKLLVTFPVGGSADQTMRSLAAKAAHILGQPVLVENRPGADSARLVRQLKASAADGYTLAQIPAVQGRAASSAGKGSPALADEVAYVINVTGYEMGFVLSADSPLSSWGNFSGWAQAYLGKLIYGVASPPLTLDLVAHKLGQKLLQLLDEGRAGLSGSLAAHTDPIDELLAAKGLGAQRQLPDAPTFKDLGLGLVKNAPFGIGAPRGTPPAVVKRLHDAFQLAMTQTSYTATLRG